jgi:hypothetical protein
VEEDRADAMGRRLAQAAEHAGLTPADVERLVACYRAAMTPRLAAFADTHHPDFLHPGRTALILLEDVGITDPAVLCAAVMHDSARPELSTDAATVAAIGGASAAAIAAGFPPPETEDDELTEALVTLEPPALTAALAERLDDARHLHLGPRSRWASVHERAERILLPLAQRNHPVLARRYLAWCDAFARRRAREP